MKLNTEISTGGQGVLSSFPLCIPAHAYANLPTQTHQDIHTSPYTHNERD